MFAHPHYPQINGLGTLPDVTLRRIIVLSLPATLLGSTIDLVESQKEE